jgi:hypothetical protein
MHTTLWNRLEGAGTQAPDALIPLVVQIEGSHFQANAATDGVLPGRCGWVFRAIMARAIGEDVFNGGQMAAGVWIVSDGWHPTKIQPTPNPTISAKCFIPQVVNYGTEKYTPGSSQCFDMGPTLLISEQTTTVTVNLSRVQGYSTPK